MGAAPLPRVNANPAKPPLGGFNLAVSSYSEPQGGGLRSGRLPVRREEPADRGRTRRPAALAREPLREQGREEGLSRASPDWSRKSIEAAGPRPTTPAYQDVSSAIQRTLHPPDKIDPEDTEGIYEELKANLEAAVKREGLL